MATPGIPSPISQLINGHRYGFSSIEASSGPLSFTNFQAVSYTDKLEPGIQRGQSSKKLGRTRGEYDVDGGITLLKEDTQTFIAALAALGLGGYMEAVWDLNITYSSGLTDILPHSDVLTGCRIIEIGDDHSVGNDVLVNEISLDIMELTRGGLSATSGGNSVAGALASIGGALLGGL